MWLTMHHKCVQFCDPRFVGPIVADKSVDLRDPRLKLSQEIPPEAVGGGIFDGFFQDKF